MRAARDGESTAHVHGARIRPRTDATDIENSWGGRDDTKGDTKVRDRKCVLAALNVNGRTIV